MCHITWPNFVILLQNNSDINQNNAPVSEISIGISQYLYFTLNFIIVKIKNTDTYLTYIPNANGK